MDPWVLRKVRDGLLIDFITLLWENRPRCDVPMSADRRVTCVVDLANFMEKGAVKEIMDESSGFISNYFSFPKKFEERDQFLMQRNWTGSLHMNT